MKFRIAVAVLFLAVSAAGQTAPALRGYWHRPTSLLVLYWSAVPGATQYHIFRTASYPTWQDAGTTTQTSAALYLDVNAAVVYQIQPENTSGPVGPTSNRALFTTYSYADEPIVAGTTAVRALHITDLRTAINGARAAAGLQAATWARPNLAIG